MEFLVAKNKVYDYLEIALVEVARTCERLVIKTIDSSLKLSHINSLVYRTYSHKAHFSTSLSRFVRSWRTCYHQRFNFNALGLSLISYTYVEPTITCYNPVSCCILLVVTVVMYSPVAYNKYLWWIYCWRRFRGPMCVCQTACRDCWREWNVFFLVVTTLLLQWQR